MITRARRIGSVAASAAVMISAAVLLFIGIGPRTGVYRTLTVLSGSMVPAIPVGAVVVVTPIRPEQVRVGHIVTYQIPVDDHRVVSHRVVKIEQAGANPVLVTKGDANSAPDPWRARVEGEQVWRVRYVVPFAGRAIAALRSRPAHVATVVILPGLLALVWLSEIWRRPQRPATVFHG